MSRALTDWLSAYIKYTENSEPPQNFHIWNGIGSIAGALQRKVYIKWGRSTIYPNLYIVLVGPSGEAKKGTSMEFAKPLLYSAGVKVVEGAITREALIRRMANSVENFTDGTTGQIKFQCAMTFFSEELSVFLGQQNIKLLSDLCNWYDSPATWKYDTKHMGTDNIDGICFNMIGATAPDWLPSILPREAVGGGFTARVVWVVEEGKGKSVVFPSVDEELEELLVRDLEQIALLTGEYVLDEGAKEWYRKWYLTEEKNNREGRPALLDPKLASYCARRATLIKKLAMICAASESDELIIRPRHFEKALAYLVPTEAKMGRVFGGLGQARYAYATELIMGFVAKHKVVTRTQILRFFFRDIDDYTFSVVATTLEKMGVVTLERKVGEDEVIVRLVEGKLDAFL